MSSAFARRAGDFARADTKPTRPVWRGDLPRDRAHGLDTRLRQDLADEGEANLDLAFRERSHGRRAALRELDLRLHLFGDAELPERLREADAGRRAARRIRIRNGRRREQRAFERVGCRDIRLARAPVRTATPTATLARNVSLLLTT